MPPLPHSHTKNGSAKQRSCLGGGGRAALMAMSGRWRRWRRWWRQGRQGGGQQCLLCLACVGVGLLTRRLMLRAQAPGRQGGGSGARFAWLWQRKAAELFGQWWQGVVDGNVRALAAAHPWMSAAVAAAAAAAGGGAAVLA
jgi:hypothetical protein